MHVEACLLSDSLFRCCSKTGWKMMAFLSETPYVEAFRFFLASLPRGGHCKLRSLLSCVQELGMRVEIAPRRFHLCRGCSLCHVTMGRLSQHWAAWASARPAETDDEKGCCRKKDPPYFLPLVVFYVCLFLMSVIYLSLRLFCFLPTRMVKAPNVQS